MKSFEIDQTQVARIVAGLIADELSWRFKRHIDFLTLAGWSAETPLGADGIGLAPAEAAACWQRVAQFFSIGAGAPAPSAKMKVGDIAERVEDAIRRSLTVFSFTPAGRDSATESCAHRADIVFRDAAATANLLYGRRRMISLVAPQSYFGLAVTVAAPKLLRVPVLDARGLAPEELQSKLAFGDVVVATPSLWRYLMREEITAPDNAMGVYFGEAMAAELVADMRKAGFGALRELYGSTETGLVAWRDSPSESFALFDHWRRDDGDIVREAPDGESEKLPPMDELEWTGKASFRLGERRDGAVQIGAVNVFPDRIASVIREHDSVDDCRIRVARHAGGVCRLVARIKLNPEVAPSESTARAIDNWCRTHLRPPERPRIYNFEASLDE